SPGKTPFHIFGKRESFSRRASAAFFGRKNCTRKFTAGECPVLMVTTEDNQLKVSFRVEPILSRCVQFDNSPHSSYSYASDLNSAHDPDEDMSRQQLISILSQQAQRNSSQDPIQENIGFFDLDDHTRFLHLKAPSRGRYYCQQLLCCLAFRKICCGIRGDRNLPHHFSETGVNGGLNITKEIAQHRKQQAAKANWWKHTIFALIYLAVATVFFTGWLICGKFSFSSNSTQSSTVHLKKENVTNYYESAFLVYWSTAPIVLLYPAYLILLKLRGLPLIPKTGYQ
ncbi:hypothetical protein Ciccas_011666, partial [Cichlidogyrus casuarinus]